MRNKNSYRGNIFDFTKNMTPIKSFDASKVEKILKSCITLRHLSYRECAILPFYK